VCVCVGWEEGSGALSLIRPGDISFRIAEHMQTRPFLHGRHKSSQIVVCDINSSMLSQGMQRAKGRSYGQSACVRACVRVRACVCVCVRVCVFVRVSPPGCSLSSCPVFTHNRHHPCSPIGTVLDWVVGDAEDLPLPDASVDAYTIAFGIRNVTHIEK
jgi:hypothetical protein